MTATRCLIVNADDFGQSAKVNGGVIEAHERGIVTSASLMVRWPAAADAAAWARSRPRLSLGLHFDLGEWICENDEWRPLYEVVRRDDAGAVAEEFARQLEAFRRLAGGDPTHLDSHQHVHMDEPARSVLADAARRLRIPLRRCTPQVRYCGDFYGQDENGAPFPSGTSLRTLLRVLRSLQPGATELGCHPGFGNSVPTMYREERVREVEVLCDARARAAVDRAGVELCSFRDVG
jgi:chitin disaccharide deacetylase